ncbi:MAG: SH3 domain-containing protein, partial [Acidobacteriales bacterium]|nr:SH3 domain-containing protein [Terriglobales bacterium]
MVIVLAGLVSTPAMASSLPGDVFYPVKRQLETVELNINPSPPGQAGVHLNQASRRVDESDRLLDNGRFEAFLLDDALASLNAAIAIAQANNLYSADAGLQQRTITVFTAFTDNLVRADTGSLIAEADYLRIVAGGQTTAAIVSFLTFNLSAAPITEPIVPTATPQPTDTPPPATATATPTTQPEATEEVTPEASEPVEATAEITAEGTETVGITEDETPAASEEFAVVASSAAVNVRSGPGTQYTPVTQLQPSTVVEVVAFEREWVLIELADGRTGYVFASLLTNASAGGGDFGCSKPGNFCNAPGQGNGSRSEE